MSAYVRVPFFKAVRDATSGNPKIKQREYSPEGPVPILDQGQDFISGYTTKGNAYTGSLPVVLFGDHTRTFKYVDFPFALGADGVKVLIPHEGFEASFLYYYFRNAYIPNAGYSRHFKFLRNLSVCKPSLPQQVAIARFLDHMDRCIARYIKAKEKLIALLEEWRQVVVSDAVTGRLDVRSGKPYPAYKPSGVEWLGEVPAHWEVIPNRAIFSEIKDQDHPQEQMLSVTISEGVVQQEELLKDMSKKDSSRSDKTKYKLVEPGDVAYNKMRAWQGAIGVSEYRGIISPAYVVQRPRVGAHSRYLHYLLRTPAFAKEAERCSYGITSDMWSLRPEHFKMIYGCLPPLPEQTAIARFLNEMIEKIQKGVAQAQREVDLLREYRTRLIADVVTGKLDVREAADTLPETEPVDAAQGTGQVREVPI